MAERSINSAESGEGTNDDDQADRSDDVQAESERMKAQGAEFTVPPTNVTGSSIATLNDTYGNLIQVTQLMHR
jgi:hypothetical protein